MVEEVLAVYQGIELVKERRKEGEKVKEIYGFDKFIF